MARMQRRGAFMLRLLIVLSIPLAGAGYLALNRIVDRNDAATAAHRSLADARVQQAVASVVGRASVEHIALEALAQVDRLLIDRDTVMSMIEIDLEGIHAEQWIRLDDALTALDEEFGDRSVVDTTGNVASLADRLGPVRADLVEQAALVEQRSASPEAISSSFDELGALLVDVTSSSSATDRRTAEGDTVRWRLQALHDVLAAEANRGRSVLDGVFDRGAASSLDVVRAESVLDAAIARFRSILGPEEIAAFDELMTHLRPLPEELLSVDAVADASEELDLPFVVAAAGAILDQLALHTEIERYSENVHEAAVTNLQQQADAAESAARATTIGFGLVSALSLLLVLMIGWSTLRPLRRLTRHAAQISGGAFDTPPLRPTGPTDVRTLTTTMNDMLATLRTVDGQISALSNGQQLDREVQLPGRVGVSLRRSFDLLAQTTAQLHASEQLASAIVEQAADAIWTIDADGTVRSANQASELLLGRSRDEQVGSPLADHLPTLDGAVTVTSSTGTTTQVLVTSSDVDGADEPLTAVIAHDIDERARYEAQLAHQATHDPLTGLPNRAAVLERLQKSPAGAPLGVLFVDLDGFKSVNDTRGHVTGDRVLTEVGRRLVSRVRPTDFVGRLGGDEFVLVLHECDPESLIAFGSRLIRELEMPHGDGDQLFMLSASVGVATFPDGLAVGGLTALDAIRCADSAVYEAKRHGRGRVELFDADLQASVVRDAEIEIALRNAVGKNELVLHLQPLVDLELGEFRGAEALVRWDRPGHGLVPPGQFIPIAERSALIIEIERWVLTQACETVAAWREIDPDTTHRLAINVAGSHLVDGNILFDLDRAIEQTGADPHLLEFEITETQVMDDVDRATAVLSELRTRGVTVAIDDFGTGYSSMAYLRQLPIDTLKIDGSFLANLTDADFDPTVLDALLAIGHALGLSVVAEGIENEAQLAHVRSRGCDRVQGFHLARPQAIEDAERLLFGVHDELEDLHDLDETLDETFGDDTAEPCDTPVRMMST